ncbi:MAG TPA: enoyl-CoA hydratase/isomerase family protein [Actinomycetota bacterium]|nr:enoyl-CoA hydratase/isomerase family protein [Actinomycetota bacterium]
MAELVRVRREGAVAVLTLNRPEKLNALSSSVEEALAAAVGSEEVATSAALVIEGSGRAFSAGADVHEMREQSVAAILEYYRTTGVVYDRVAALRQPTIAAIHGYCLGGGFELALACDFRIADATAVFGLPEVAIGIVPSSGGLTRLVRSVGAARAKELMLLRDRFDAQEALGFGLVTAVVPEGSAAARAIEIGNELAQLPPLAVEVAKLAADAAADSSREASLLIERLAYAALAQTADHAEATSAFEEKRDPTFGGR